MTMATQPPLPGMGKDAVRGKKKKSTQPTLPGMKKMERSFVPKSDEPKAKKSKTGLGEELRQGNLPMFMTAGEQIKHFDLGDAGMARTMTQNGKSDYRKRREKGLMARKLRESKTGSMYNSWEKAARPGVISLHDSIAEHGFDQSQGSVHVTAGRPATLTGWRDPAKKYPKDLSTSNDTLPEVINGHHRLAAMRNLHPKQFMSVMYRGLS